MAEKQQSSNTKVLFVNLSSSLSCRNLGSSGPQLHRLVIRPFLDRCTDSAGGYRLGETINTQCFTQKHNEIGTNYNRVYVYMIFFHNNV
jgi:hypothetical protein